MIELDMHKPTLVLYTKTNCKFCVDLAPAWAQATHMLQESKAVIVYTVDASEAPRTVVSFPTIARYTPFDAIPHIHQGPRSVEALVAFAISGNDVVEDERR